MTNQICVARIGAAHGIRGEVRLWTFTEDPLAVQHYGPLATKDGTRHFEVTRAREAKDHLVATLQGVSTRDDAESSTASNSTSPAISCPPPMTTNTTTPT